MQREVQSKLLFYLQNYYVAGGGSKNTGETAGWAERRRGNPTWQNNLTLEWCERDQGYIAGGAELMTVRCPLPAHTHTHTEAQVKEKGGRQERNIKHIQHKPLTATAKSSRQERGQILTLPFRNTFDIMRFITCSVQRNQAFCLYIQKCLKQLDFLGFQWFLTLECSFTKRLCYIHVMWYCDHSPPFYEVHCKPESTYHSNCKAQI